MKDKKTFKQQLYVLRNYLNSPAHASNLFDETPDMEPRTFIPGTVWTRLPRYYPSNLPRCSFRVDWDDGTTVFIKLNAEVRKILREGNVCRFLRKHFQESFTVPDVLDMEINTPEGNALPYAWLVTDWFSGSPAAEAEERTVIQRVANALALLHTMPLALAVHENVFGLQGNFPSIEEFAGLLRKRQLNSLKEASKTPDKELNFLLEHVGNILRTFPLDMNLTLIHGDFHFYNILVKSRNTIQNTLLCFFDWEDATVGEPFDDVAHLIIADGIDRGKSFMNFYLDAAKLPYDHARSARMIWLLSGVYLARSLYSKLQAVRHKDEQASICNTAKRVLQTIISEIGEE